MQRGEKRDFATAANCHQCRAAARHAACTWSRRCRARPSVETLQSCKRTACPGSGKRVRIAGIATLPPPHAASCASPPPRQAAVARSRVRRARTDVGTSQTCAHAARMGAGNTPKSPEVEVVGGEGRSGRTHKVARNRYAQLGRTTGSGARSTTSSVRRRVVEFWVDAHANR